MTNKNSKTPSMGQIETQLKSEDKNFSSGKTDKNKAAPPLDIVLQTGRKTEKVVPATHLWKKPTKKALLKAERKRLQVEEYSRNQQQSDLYRSKMRDHKFAHNFTSPGKKDKLVYEAELDYQSSWLSTKMTHEFDAGVMADIHSLSENLSSGIDMRHVFEEKFTNTFEKFSEVLQDLSGKIPNMNPRSADFAIPHLGYEITKSAVSNVVDVAMYGLSLYLIYSLFAYEQKRTKKTVGTLIVVLTIFSLRCATRDLEIVRGPIGKALKNLIGQFERSPETFEESTVTLVDLDYQMETNTFEGILELVSLYIFGKIVGQAPEGKTLKELFKEAGSFKRSMEGVKSLSNTVLKFVEMIINWVRVKILDLHSVQIVESDVLEVKVFVAECMEIADLCHKDKFLLNIPNSDIIHALWVRGNELLNKYSKRDMIELRLQVQNQMTYITKVRARFVEANLLTLGTRQAPLCILIRGSSGVGKSAATIPLVTSLLGMILPEEELTDFRANYESFIYGRQAEHVYWDGYRGQFVCAFDDFGQLKDVAGQGENEYSEFIRAGNVFGYILHMADIESKGGVAFRSKVCIATSNLRKIQPESIVQPEAVTRRFDIVADQVPPIEFCTTESLKTGDLWERRLDRSKVAGSFDKRACEYHLVKFVNGDSGVGTHTGEVLTFDQLVDLMVDKYEAHEAQAENYKVSLENNVQEYLLRREQRKRMDTPMPLHYQMNLDDHESGSSIDSLDGDEFDSITDPAVLAFLSFNDGNPALDHVYGLIKGLRKKIGLQHIGEVDLLDQLIRASHGMYQAVKTWHAGHPHESAVETNKVLTLLTIFVSELYANDRKCKVIYENLNASISKTLYAKWKGATTRSYEFCQNYFEKLKEIMARFPVLVWFMNNLPYGELILAVLIPASAAIFSVAIVKKGIDGILLFIKYLFPSFFEEEVEQEIVQPVLEKKKPQKANWKTEVNTQPIFGNIRAGASLESQSATKMRPAHKTTKEYVRMMRNKSKVEPRLDTQLGTSDKVLDQIMTKVIENNCYELWVTNKRKAGYVTFLQGRAALMPWHFATEIAAQVEEDPSVVDDFFILKKARSTIQHSFRVSLLLEAVRATAFETQDACIVLFPREMPNHKDITRYIHTEKTSNMVRDKKFVLYSPNVERVVEWHGEHYQEVFNTRVGLTVDNVTYVRKGYRYSATTDKGDCGSLMCAVDPSTGKEKIIGIHTGGNQADAHGFSTALCYEDIMESLDLVRHGIVETLVETAVNFDYETNIVMLDGRFVTLATSEKLVRASEYTAIGPSKLIGEWQPPVTTPGRLKPFENEEGKLIDPFKVGLAKYCKPHVMIDTELMKIIGEHILNDLCRVSSVDTEKRIFTFDEAVLGLENDPNYGSIPRGTSPGFPHNVMPDKKPGKTKFFGDGAMFDLHNEACKKLRSDVEETIETARWQQRQPFFYCDFLKDERRTHKKYEEGNTRIFSACPLEYAIAVRMYFGAFTLWIANNKIYNGSAIGLNPYSYDWQILANQLAMFGDKVGAGDYKGFDGSEQPEIHWAILDVINKWYDDGEPNAGIRSMLWLELVNSRHIRGNLVYEWVSSLPSGHPLTTLVNILYGFFAFRYCWYRAHDNDENSLFRFSKNVFLCELGDDNIYNFSDACSDKFNQRTISGYMAEIGLTYTDEDKQTGSIVEYRRLEECTFLKRGFRREILLDRYVGPLALETVLESPYWTTKNSQKDSITQTTTETCLMELALHDIDTWNKWSPKIIEAFNKHYFAKLDCTSRKLLIQKSDSVESNW